MASITLLRQSRLARAVSVPAVARTLGMNENLLHKVDAGTWACPRKWRPELAAYYGVSADRLFDERGLARLVDEEA